MSLWNSKHPLDLLLFEVVAHAPVAEHFKECRVAIVTDIVDILRAEAGLSLSTRRLPSGCGLTQKIRDNRLHAAAGK